MKKQTAVKKPLKPSGATAKKTAGPVVNSKAVLAKKSAPQPAKKAVTGKKKTGSSALSALAMGRSATAQVDARKSRVFANTGTNVSYEGATAPGSGGSVGTGYASGKAAVDEKLTTGSDYEQSRVLSPNKKKKAAGKAKK